MGAVPVKTIRVMAHGQVMGGCQDEGTVLVSYVWRLNDKDGMLRESFAGAVNILRSPAGSKYRTLEDCQKNKYQFGRDFHNGLFRFHLEMINQIMLVEEKLKTLPDQSLSENRISKCGFEHLRQIFRTLNDCIVWAVFPEPSFLINRLCRRRERGHLKDQNPASILRVITKLSETGETLAIWNDATRCIDLFDVTAISLESGHINFYEVKEGVINEEISQIVSSKDVKKIEESLDDLYARRGISGINQFGRFVRQQLEGKKLHTLVSNEHVEDPYLKMQRAAISPRKPLESYDQQLDGLLTQVRRKEFARIVIDDCLHILAINQERLSNNHSIDMLIEEELKKRIHTPSTNEPDCRKVLLWFQESIYSPIAMPVMLRPFDAHDIADICIGNVVLFFMFDMNAWGRLFEESRLSWSSKKEGRRELSKPFLERRMVIDSRVPTITSGTGKYVRLGDRILPLMMCESVRPLSMAQEYDYLLSH